MADASGTSFPFDMASVAEDMQRRFGWNADNLNAAMSHLMPAAMAGFRHFAPDPQILFGFGAPQSDAFDAFNPMRFLEAFGGSKPADRLMPFFGPESVRRAVAEQIAQATGLHQKAVQEMMPVAATLAMAQIVRPYLQGEAQTLFDAFMRGFIRGRPKPMPKPMDYVQGYADAVTAFWSSFLSPAVSTAEQPEEDMVEEVDIELDDDASAGDEPTAAAGEPSDLERMMTSWMNAGRDFQSSQFRAFDQMFGKAASDLGGPSATGDR